MFSLQLLEKALSEQLREKVLSEQLTEKWIKARDRHDMDQQRVGELRAAMQDSAAAQKDSERGQVLQERAQRDEVDAKR